MVLSRRESEQTSLTFVLLGFHYQMENVIATASVFVATASAASAIQKLQGAKTETTFDVARRFMEKLPREEQASLMNDVTKSWSPNSKSVLSFETSAQQGFTMTKTKAKTPGKAKRKYDGHDEREKTLRSMAHEELVQSCLDLQNNSLELLQTITHGEALDQFSKGGRKCKSYAGC
jgi:hypothetical protein